MPCFFANLTRSACRRSGTTAPRQRPVSGFLHGRKGFRGVNEGCDGGTAAESIEVSSRTADIELDVSDVAGRELITDGAVCDSDDRCIAFVRGYEAPVNLAE